jgi:serine/threonine protein kinase
MDDRLKLVREISRSGVATVWEGRDTELDRKVLVKSIHPQFVREGDLRARFEREARAIARLSHPNVVQIYDIRSDSESLALILEFIEGLSLGALLKQRGALPYPLALRILHDILVGLEHAHAAGIIHRDLKPDNILISHRGQTKITDFGLATLRDLPAVTQEGMVIGTPAYMAPEQALGGEIGPQTDLFSCGSIFFEMLTGRKLIAGESLGEVFQNVVKYRAPDLSAYPEWIPPASRELLDQLLERDPTARPALQAAKVRVAGMLPQGLPSEQQIADFIETDTGKMAPAPIAPSPRSRTPIMIGLAVLLSVILISVAVYVTSRVPEIPVAQKPIVTDSIPERSPDTTKKTEPVVTMPRDTTHARPVAPETTRSRPQKPDTLRALPAGPSYATFASNPWSRVYLADSLLGQTPIASPIALPAGRASFVFLNPEINHPVTRSFDLEAQDTLRISVDLNNYLARVKILSVKPWADVYIDGVFQFKTPSSQVIYLPLGKHAVELRHPELDGFYKEVSFKEGDPVYEVRADLTKKM